MYSLLHDKYPSIKLPIKVLFPVRTKSAFNAGVPEYAIDMASPWSAHIFLKLFSKTGLNAKNGFDVGLESNFNSNRI